MTTIQTKEELQDQYNSVCAEAGQTVFKINHLTAEYEIKIVEMNKELDELYKKAQELRRQYNEASKSINEPTAS